MDSRLELPKYILLDRQASERLRHLRWSHDVTWDVCAEALNIAVFDFLEKERGRKTFSEREFAALASIFRLTPQMLLATLKHPAV